MQATLMAKAQIPKDDGAERRWQLDAEKAQEIAGVDYDHARRKRAMLYLYRKGYPYTLIGKLFSVTKQRVYSVIRDDIGDGYLQSIAEERAELAQKAIPAFQEGKTRAEVAKLLGLTTSELNTMVMAARKAASRGRSAVWAAPLISAMNHGRTMRKTRQRAELGEIARAINASGKGLREIAKKARLAYSSVHELSHFDGDQRWFPTAKVLRKLAAAVPALRSHPVS